MIKEISFEEIKPFWEKLWPDIDVYNDTEYVSLYECEYVEDIFFKLKRHSPRSIPAMFLAYFLDDKIVGVVNGYKTATDFFRIRGLWVEEDFRDQNIATRLMTYIESYALSLNCTTLWTIPRKTALGFYKNYGFIQTTDFVIYDNNNCLAVKQIQRRD